MSNNEQFETTAHLRRSHSGLVPDPRPQDPALAAGQDPYRVWISEIMLQQTQVATVIPYYERFMARFPDVLALADAPIDEVLHPLDRAWLLRPRPQPAIRRPCRSAIGTAACSRSGWREVMALPGIGRSTAGAVLSLSWPAPRHPGRQREAGTHPLAGAGGLARSETGGERSLGAGDPPHPRVGVAQYNQAMMDMGATVCTRSKPACERCPVRDDCQAVAGQPHRLSPQQNRRRASRPAAASC